MASPQITPEPRYLPDVGCREKFVLCGGEEEVGCCVFERTQAGMERSIDSGINTSNYFLLIHKCAGELLSSHKRPLHAKTVA